MYLGTTNHDAAFSYDEAGDVLHDDTGRSFTYDALSMTTGATAPLSIGGARNFAYIYTADDERIALVEKLASGATTTNWTLRGLDNHLLRTWTSSSTTGWSWREDDIWRGAALLAYESPTGVRHYGLDHLGSPAILTDATAHPVGTITFDAFGNGGATGAGMLQYTGHERDSANVGPLPGTVILPDYLHARNYSPTVGRFLSVDPALDLKRTLLQPQRWNRYSYVVNNPINAVDPDGRADVGLDCVPASVCTAAVKAQVAAAQRQAMKLELPIVAGFLVGAEVPALARAAFTAFPRTFMALMGIGGGMTGAPSVNLGSGARPIAGRINGDNLSAGFRGNMQQIQVAGNALSLPFQNGSIGNVTAQNLPSILLGQGEQQLAGELGRTMQSGSTLTITTQTPGRSRHSES